MIQGLVVNERWRHAEECSFLNKRTKKLLLLGSVTSSKPIHLVVGIRQHDGLGGRCSGLAWADIKPTAGGLHRHARRKAPRIKSPFGSFCSEKERLSLIPLRSGRQNQAAPMPAKPSKMAET